MIELREFSHNDIDSIARHANNYNVSRYMSSRIPYPFTKGDAEWWVETGNKQAGLYMAVVLADDLADECIGVVGVRFGQFESQHSAEIGYWLAEQHWGKGIATEAVSKMTDIAFTDNNILRLYAPVFSPNKASMRVLEKCGYTLEAVHRMALMKNNELMDEHIYVRFHPLQNQ
jgi:ribosomal-protein-alanine N-acetyltransferase